LLERYDNNSTHDPRANRINNQKLCCCAWLNKSKQNGRLLPYVAKDHRLSIILVHCCSLTAGALGGVRTRRGANGWSGGEAGAMTSPGSVIEKSYAFFVPGLPWKKNRRLSLP
jgi:hypothetical protein